MAFRSGLEGGRFIALALILILAISLASPVHAASENQIEVRVAKRSMLNLNTDTVVPGEYPAVVEYTIDFWNMRDESGEGLREIKITIKPKDPDAIREIHTDNVEIISKDPVIVTRRGMGEDEGASLTIITTAKERAEVPLKITRSADVAYFEDTGKQVASLVITPLSPDINGLPVTIEFGGDWSGEEAEVSFVSASREYFQRVADDNRAEFNVENPMEGQECRFAVQLEVTPLHGKVTYLPGVWTSAMMDIKELEQVEGKVYRYDTEFGSFEFESADEVRFIPMTGREVAISLSSVSTQEKLLEIATPAPTQEETLGASKEVGEVLSTEKKEEGLDVALPMGQPIMKVNGEGGLYGVDWEFVGVILVVLGTIAGTTITWVKGRKRRGVVSRQIRQIDAVYTEPGTGPADKREELRKMKRKISKQFGKGKLDEGAYGILDKRVDDYLKELRSSAGVSNIELKAEIDKILEDGIVTKDEYEEFSEMLEKGHELKAGEKKELKKRIEEIRDESEKKGF